MNGRARLFATLFILSIQQSVQSQTNPPQRIQGRGVEVSVPPGWQYNRALLQSGGPIALTNFGGKYLEGGLLPPGGAEIEVISVPRPIDLSGYARAELPDVRQLRFEEGASNGQPILRATYVDEVGDGVTTQTVVYYVPQGGRLYKFYMTFSSGDPQERKLIQTLETVVRDSVR